MEAVPEMVTAVVDAYGAVNLLKSVALPSVFTLKSEVVAVSVEEAMLKSVVPEPGIPCTERRANGEVVPTPKLLLRKVRPVPLVMLVPSKKFTPLVVCVVALVPPRAIGSVPVVLARSMFKDDVAVQLGRPVV